MAKLKVYGFSTYQAEAEASGSFNKHCRTIIAAHSVAEVMRLTGATRSEVSVYGCVTNNPNEIETAMAEPCVAFWKQPKDRFKVISDWYRAEPKRTEQ